MPDLHVAGDADLSDRHVVDDGDELDRRLLAAAARGDRVAFDELVERHAAALLRLLRSIVRDDAMAEDALQETFLAAYRGAAGFRGEGRVRGWLLTIARHRALRAIGTRQPMVADEDDLDALGLAAGWADDDSPEQAAESSERAAVLQAALAELSVEDRTVIVLHDLEGLSGPETAEVIGLSLAATKSRLHRARLRLLAGVRGRGLQRA